MPQLQTRRARSVQAPLETYFREIDQTALLDIGEEQELGYRVEEGDSEARDWMVRANLRLVVNIARSYTGKGLNLEDLIAEGNLGLLRAVEGFDPSMGIRFSTYATYWIKQSIKRAVINTGKTVRIPAYMNELMVKWRKATAKLQEELGRTPTQEEVASSLGLPKKKLKIIQKALHIYNAGQQADQADGGWPLDELADDSTGQGPGFPLAEAEDVTRVLGLFNHLEPRAATVLRMRFGLGGGEPLTLKEIGDRLGLTRERVRQIERDSLAQLRELVGEE